MKEAAEVRLSSPFDPVPWSLIGPPEDRGVIGQIQLSGGAYEPQARLRDMDIQGIDQVMIIPSDIDTYPWLQNDVGAKAMCKAYNEWAYEYCQENPERLYFAALLPLQPRRRPSRRPGSVPRRAPRCAR